VGPFECLGHHRVDDHRKDRTGGERLHEGDRRRIDADDSGIADQRCAAGEKSDAGPQGESVACTLARP
jgi:hypothetical protein